MFMGMTPRSAHRYYLSSHGLVFEASWPQPARTGLDWVRAGLYNLFFDGPTPGTPEHAVDPDALSAAIGHVEEQDIEAATRAFTKLGYIVDVHEHSLR
jgi:hypothetical protein